MKLIYKGGVFAIVVLSFGSCKKFVQISPPTNELVTGSVFNNTSSAISTETAIYTQMATNGESYAMSQQNGLLADEFTNYSKAALQISIYEDGMSTAIGSYGCWIHGYNYIYQANAILSAMQGSDLSPAIVNQITGEAKFIRAFWHFYLTNEYGDIPLVLTPQYNLNSQLGRTPRAQVFRQVANDLLDAENLLNENYVDATDTAVSMERVRPNKAVAAAMLARTYLYMGNYDSAELQATNVINNPRYSLIQPLTPTNYVFTKNSSEAIWQLSTPLPAANNGATPDGNSFILTSSPTNVAMSTILKNSFEQGDQRAVIWIDSFKTNTVPQVTYYFPYKYKVNSKSPAAPSIPEYVMVLRLAEQYLIRAEARAQENNLTGSASDLNIIRNRAGLANIADSIASTKSSMLNAILHERQVEFFAEWGHRWFDLNRIGAVDSVMGNPVDICHSKGGTWSGNSKLYPILPTELAVDPNLTQNPGY